MNHYNDHVHLLFRVSQNTEIYKFLNAYKYRIYPDVEQQIYIAKAYGCRRFIYNQMLDNRIEIYEVNKDVLTSYYK